MSEPPEERRTYASRSGRRRLRHRVKSGRTMSRAALLDALSTRSCDMPPVHATSFHKHGPGEQTSISDELRPKLPSSTEQTRTA